MTVKNPCLDLATDFSMATQKTEEVPSSKQKHMILHCKHKFSRFKQHDCTSYIYICLQRLIQLH